MIKTKKKILILIGTRPEAIKLAPVIMELRKHSDIFETIVCATGQHKEMLFQAFSDFNITPDIDLRAMRPRQTLAGVSARLFESIDLVLEKEQPDWVLVQGDTTTVMVGALCCFYRKIRIGHVEAGLRSHNRWLPFPEEINRRVAGLVADLHFAPTEIARKNLIAEGIAEETIIVTGNTVIDALLWMVKVVREESPGLPLGLEKDLKDKRKIVLITGHRRENFGARLEQICLSIRDLVSVHSDTVFVYSVHLNPNVQKTVRRIIGGIDRIILTAPLPYKSFVKLMDMSSIILTDSGGIQEEAPSLGKPVLVMRNVTERPEGLAAGTSILIGTKRDLIVAEASKILNNFKFHQHMSSLKNPYGDGKAAQRIVEALISRLEQ